MGAATLGIAYLVRQPNAVQLVQKVERMPQPEFAPGAAPSGKFKGSAQAKLCVPLDATSLMLFYCQKHLHLSQSNSCQIHQR